MHLAENHSQLVWYRRAVVAAWVKRHKHGGGCLNIDLKQTQTCLSMERGTSMSQPRTPLDSAYLVTIRDLTVIFSQFQRSF